MEIEELKGTSGEALLRFAIDSEQLSEQFYRLVANRLKVPQMQILFAEFAEQEELHRRTFEKLRPADLVLPPETELQDNLRLLHEYFRETLFNPHLLGEKLRRLSDPESAYNLAVSVELDSMIFYGELKPLMPPGERPVVEEIINQERSHFQRLLRIKQARNY